jgi:hypothetical protein
MILRMSEKQKPSHEFRIQTPSIPDLVEGLANARMRLNRRSLKHRGRKLADGPLVNAIVAWYLSRLNDEQARIAAEGLKLYEAMLGDEGMAEGETAKDGVSPNEPVAETPRVKRRRAGS